VVLHESERLVAGTIDGTIVTWDLTTGRETLTLHGGEKRIASLAFVRDGTTLVAASVDGYVRFWDATPLGPAPPP
jgi:WD40 repeat protein